MQNSVSLRPIPPGKPGRMSLAAVTRGKIEAPCRVLLYGTEGVGKSTWAAGAPAPIFLCGEEGTNHLDIARFPKPDSWSEVFDTLRVLRSEPHDFKTFVIDTADALEPLCWTHVARAASKAAFSEFDYGRGHVAAFAEWQRLLVELDALRYERGMMIVTLAHAQVRTWKNPSGADYDRFTLKLNERAGNLLKEQNDVVLFARHEEYAKGDGRQAKGVSTGKRVVHTTRTAAWDAKNRFNLPEVLPLEWSDFERARTAQKPADPARTREEITALIARLEDGDVRAKADASLRDAGDDAALLVRIKNRLEVILSQKED